MRLKRPLYLYIAASIAFTGFTQTASATLVSAEQVAQTTTPAQAADARAQVAAALDRPEVQAELVRQGVDPAAARERVAALSDEDATRLASHIDSAPAGGIIGVILLVFFVLLITDIIGWTKVFPFTRSMR